MPSLPPEGEIPPDDGSLPGHARASIGRAPFQIYVHVPFCASRCGYCDFNTYTASELGADVRRETFAEVLGAEIAFARGRTGSVPVDAVFIGGGTPTLIGADALVGILRRIEAEFGLAPDAEVTTEANPDSVDEGMLDALRAGGFTRISFGMQSASSAVLGTLDRTHTPGAADRMIRAARAAGFAHVSADLIIGTPGETDDDLRASVALAVDAGVDHVSAYTLIVEPGTPLARRVAAGEVPMPDDDVAAHRYELADRLLTEAGFRWYEVSNWARPGGECRHNLGYWRTADWWGIGPGAHSHVGGVRWWNLRHPSRYAERIAQGLSPAQGREVLTLEQRREEAVMLGVRLREGIAVDALDMPGRTAAALLADRGLLDRQSLARGRVQLTDAGRLLADAVIREVLP